MCTYADGNSGCYQEVTGAEIGEPLQLCCRSTSCPESGVRWTNRTSNAAAVIENETSSVLTVSHSVTVENGGQQYGCTCQDSSNNASRKGEFTIYGTLYENVLRGCPNCPVPTSCTAAQLCAIPTLYNYTPPSLSLSPSPSLSLSLTC